ncbi:MAG: hypothetical protein O2960_09685 [Verrucomicrobia bacterium]|nr:hypothetical protein [Verrucomicrobiota bacterium]
MRRSVLFIVSGDPRTSPRPAEAIRIAAGIIAGNRIDVRVLLRDGAVIILQELTDDFVDEDHYARYLPILAESGNTVLVRREPTPRSDVCPTAVPFREVTDREASAIAAESDCVVCF